MALPLIVNALVLGYKAYRRKKKLNDLIAISSVSAVALEQSKEEISSLTIQDLNDGVQSLQDFMLSGLPEFTKEFSVSVEKPLTMPDYLQNQNDLAQAQIEKTNNLTDQALFNNELLAKSIQEQQKANSISSEFVKTMTSILPAFVVQLEEISKIPAVLSLSSEIDTAYKEQALENHTQLVDAVKALELSVTNEAPVVNVEDQTQAINALTSAVQALDLSVTSNVSAPSVSVEAPVVNVQAPSVTNEVSVPSVNVEAPIINVASQETAITALTSAVQALDLSVTNEAPIVNVEDQTQAITALTLAVEALDLSVTNEAPIVNVEDQTQAITALTSAVEALDLSVTSNVSAPSVSVEAPVVNVQAPSVTNEVSVPSVNVEAPIINVASQETAITALTSAVQALDLSVTNEAPIVNVEDQTQAITALTSAVHALDLSVTNEAPIVNVESQEQALNNLTTATTEQTQELQKVATNLNAVSTNAQAQQKVAEYQTTVARITRLDGTVYAELTPQELSTKKDISLAEAKAKEIELAEYQTTTQTIKDINGHTITRAKPIDIAITKDAVLSRSAEQSKENANKIAQAVDNHSTVQTDNSKLSNDYIAGLSNTIITSSNSRAVALNAQTEQLQKVSEKLTSVSANAISQKVLADYAQTQTEIKNLDGNTVATMKPMEAQAVKNVVDAKNATDEMEFELDDSTLNTLFDAIPLPSYTKLTLDQDYQQIFENWRT